MRSIAAFSHDFKLKNFPIHYENNVLVKLFFKKDYSILEYKHFKLCFVYQQKSLFSHLIKRRENNFLTLLYLYLYFYESTKLNYNTFLITKKIVFGLIKIFSEDNLQAFRNLHNSCLLI